mmetsp:Transcript_14373/g.15031  ORF Transcript_14373/g.15031 Transcript_14373/m.15031 type:complete len:1153 (+) Transcript_14373:2-3460(+)
MILTSLILLLLNLILSSSSPSSLSYQNDKIKNKNNFQRLLEEEDEQIDLGNITKNGPLADILFYRSTIFKKGTHPDVSTDLGNDIIILKGKPSVVPTFSPTIDPKIKPKPDPKSDPKTKPAATVATINTEIKSKIRDEDESFDENHNQRRRLSPPLIKKPSPKAEYYSNAKNLRGNNENIHNNHNYNYDINLQEQTLINVEGIPVNGGAPSDSCMTVGPSHFVQVVNDKYAIFDKTTGNMLSGYPKPGYQLYSSFNDGTNGALACRTSTQGDPTVQYDKFANRWVFSEFAWTSDSGPYYQCFAVSKTSDPTGGYWYYAFQGLTASGTSVFPDYGKISIWPDAYYITYNLFGSNYAGAQVCGFNRTSMLNGGNASPRCKDFGTSYGSMLVADLEGKTLPKLGKKSTNFVIGIGNTQSNLLLFNYSYTSNKLTNPISIPINSWTSPCSGSSSCVPQPGISDGLDALADRLMYRAVYRNFGNHESLLVVHTVQQTSGAFGQVGVRWYEIRGLSTKSPYIYQQSTFQPDSTSRWMGSIAINGAGTIALGYSVSSSSIYPGIRYTYRLSSDPLNTMRNEVNLYSGSGSQIGTSNRWGDYTCLQVDVSDDTSFWYTNQYIPSTGSFNWRSRVVKFDPLLTSPTALPTISSAPTTASTRAPTRSPTTSSPTSAPTNAFTLISTNPAQLSLDSTLSGTQYSCNNIILYGSFTTLSMSLNFPGSSSNSWAADMALIVSRLSNPKTSFQVGGYDVQLKNLTLTASWPTNWQSSVAGIYTSTVNISKLSWSGSSTYQFCVLNGWSSSGYVHYIGTITLDAFATTNSPTIRPTTSPTRKPTIATTQFPTKSPTRRPTSATLPYIYSNGNLITSYGGGYNGYDVSELTSGYSSLGYNVQYQDGYFAQDNFIITGNSWSITSIDFFVYQINSSSVVSPIKSAFLEIYQGSNFEGLLVFGDMSTDRLSSTSWSQIYRTNTGDLLSKLRPIMKVTVTCVVSLEPGEYFFKVGFIGDDTSQYPDPYMPVVSPQDGTGNARQIVTGGGVVQINAEFPFIIRGSLFTHTPTKIPTYSPSVKPSKTPTRLPTFNPTFNPTRLPTFKPTGSPSIIPTRLPTLNPSRIPTRSPSVIPTRSPTRVPTPLPSRLPTPLPSRSPTRAPSRQPTRIPT